MHNSNYFTPEFQKFKHREDTFNWNYFLKSMESSVSLDFSRCGITCIPDEILEKFVNIQFLYLEGNKLTKLSNEFFPTLRQLKWLDIRNNKLSMIPNSIMDHPSLQVLLLEGNNLETIPVEIGSVDTLRGLQLARNPIRFPPPNIINQGVQSTIEFLRKQWQQLQSPQQIHLISETHSQTKAVSAKLKKTERKQKMGACKSAGVLKLNSQEVQRPRKTQSGLCAVNLSTCISVQPISRHGQPVTTTVHNDTDKVFTRTNYKRRSKSFTKSNSNSYLQHDHTKSSGDMQSKLLRDIWIEKVREMLLNQEAILQRKKNAEALQQWQDEAKELQQAQPKIGSSNVDINFPYDTDPEYLKMLSRKDLKENEHYGRRDSSVHNVRHEEPINSKILSIMTALQELQTSQCALTVSPRSEQRILSEDIKKIREIQRSLNALKLKNFGQLGFSS